MFTAAAAGTLIVSLKAHFLHESHISPKFHQKLVKLSLEKLVTSSFHIYHQAAIWLIFLWLTVIFMAISTLSEVTYLPITLFSVVISANFTWILAYDIQKEFEIAHDK